jgi:hypothetical protein
MKKMKKIMTTLVLAALLLVNSAFANNKETINERVQSAFRQEFSKATETNWSRSDNYYRVEFTLNDNVMTAYYNENAELMGVIKNLLSTELPINLQLSLKKEYGSYWISDLFEFARNGESGYFITVENSDTKLVLQSEGSDWKIFKKIRK